MPARRIATPLYFTAALLLGSITPAGAQSSSGPMRTIDIPPSRIEPQPSLELDLPKPDETLAAEDVAPAAPSVEPDDGTSELNLDLTSEPEPELDEAAAEAMAAADAARLRAANADQLSAARRQLDQITADKRAEQDRLARYREEQAAHAAAMSAYEAQLAASRAARQRWQDDVAACQAGDRYRCGATAPRR